jgi:transposase
MNRISAARLKADAQNLLRRQIVSLKDRGMRNKLVAETLEVSAKHVSTIWCSYKREGIEALATKPRGHAKGVVRLLTPEQEIKIQEFIRAASPDSYMLPFALWTLEAVAQLIRTKFKIKIATRSVGDYLARWGFTPQRPVKQARQRKPGAVDQWQNIDYPAIAAKAKAEDAEILFF